MLFAFDLDGTLLGRDGDVPAGTLDVLGTLRERGARIALITGRQAIPDRVLDTVRPDAHATGNGARIYIGTRLHVRLTFTPQQVQSLLEFAPHDTCISCASDDLIYTSHPTDPHLGDWHGHDRLRPLHERDGQELLAFTLRHPTAPALRARITSNWPDLSVTGSFPPYAEHVYIAPPGANKGAALTHVARELAVPLAACTAFGDADNDLPMLRVAGHGVRVGNAECLAGVARESVSCPDIGLPEWLRARLNTPAHG